MANTNKFSAYREKGSVKIRKTRRIRHSFSNWKSSKFGKNRDSKSDAAKDVVSTTYDRANDVAALASVIETVGKMVGVTAVVGVSTVTAAFGAPVVGLATSIIGIALVVKGMYSNRDKAHEALKPFVWTLIDNKAPPRDIYVCDKALEDAGSAATYLMTEAESQFKCMGAKFETSEKKFNSFLIELEKYIYPLVFQGKPSKQWIGTSLVEKWRTISSSKDKKKIAQADKILLDWYYYTQSCHKTYQDKWGKANQQGGAVFEYMRRLLHVGNYLQCAGIVEQVTFSKLGKKLEAPNDKDPLARWDKTNDCRDRLQEISDRLTEAENNFCDFEKFITNNKGIIINRS